MKLRLVSSPTRRNNSKLQLAKDLNLFYFPGCQLPAWENNYVWLAYVDDEVAGFATMKKISGMSYGYLERVAVLKKYRGKGIQKKLIDVRVKYARSQGWKGVLTYTTPDNYPSVNSLMHRGFSMYWPEWCWAGKEMLYFKRDFE